MYPVFTKKLIYNTKSPYINLGKLPSVNPNTQTKFIIKIGDEFFCFHTGTSTYTPYYRTISKTKNFIDWEHSPEGVGCSGYIRYDMIANAFFVVTESVNNSTSTMEYIVYKVNPDFSYTQYSLYSGSTSNQSTAVTGISRLGNRLFLLKLEGRYTSKSFYSDDNGQSWNQTVLGATTGWGVGSSGGCYLSSNGVTAITNFYFGNKGSEYRTTTNGINFITTSSRAIVKNIPFTTVQKLININTTNMRIANADTTDDIIYTVPKNFVTSIGFIYNNYYISTPSQTQTISTSSSDTNFLDYFGKVNIIDINTGNLYIFDKMLKNTLSTSTSSSNTTYKHALAIHGIIDNELYISYGNTSSGYTLLKVAIDYVLTHKRPYIFS